MGHDVPLPAAARAAALSPQQEPSSWGLRTRAVHVGSAPDAASGAVIPPLSLSTTFAQLSPGRPVAGFDYSRSGNPTRAALEAALASVEAGGEAAAAFASGLAATDALLRAFPPGAKLLAIDDLYGGTRRLLTRVLSAAAAAPGGLHVTYADLTDARVAEEALAATAPDVVWLEVRAAAAARRAASVSGFGSPASSLSQTPTNPTLKVSDIAALASAARRANPHALLVVDNTFLSPAGQSPLLLGADFVVHSATKYIGGHSDAVLGVVVAGGSAGARQRFARLRFLQNAAGAVPAPFDCFLVHRGLKTLALRLDAAAASAAAIAAVLQSSPAVARVAYPGLPSHPQHALAARQARSFGAMIALWLRPPAGGTAAAATAAFLGALRLFTLAESLGGVESLAEAPALMTHASVPPEERAALGLDDALVRLSVGIEDTEDLLADIARGLDAAAASGA